MNRLFLRGGHDLVLCIGQVVPTRSPGWRGRARPCSWGRAAGRPSTRSGLAARLRGAALAAVVALAAAPGLAEEFKAGDLTIDDPWSRATPKGADVAAGYLVVHNRGAAPDRLLGGAADFAGDVAVHEMSMDGGVMKMRALPSSLEEFPPAARSSSGRAATTSCSRG